MIVGVLIERKVADLECALQIVWPANAGSADAQVRKRASLEKE